jgi:hypothetical protein
MVAGSTSVGQLSFFFSAPNRSSRTMAPGFAHSVAEIRVLEDFWE